LIWNPQPKHHAIIYEVFKPEPGAQKIILALCGIAFGKTTISIVIAEGLLEKYPGIRIIFFEPDSDRINTVFLPEWRKWIPEQLYKISTVENKKEIRWHNGSIMYLRHRWIYGNTETAANIARGPNIDVIISDEEALGYNHEFFLNCMGRLRIPREVCAYVALTTPQVGPFAELLSVPGLRLFHGRTRDNAANLRSGFEADERKRMSFKHAQRELDGEMVALEGRVWECWEDERNLVREYRDRNKPYILAGDIGVQSSWYCVQKHNDHYTIVSEYHADNGGTPDDLRFILSRWGQPSKIIAGQDIRSASVAGGDSALVEIKRSLAAARMSFNIPVITPNDIDPVYRDKGIQYGACCDAIETSRIRLSTACTHLDNWREIHGNGARCFYKMIQRDAFPKAGAAGWFVKDKAKNGTTAVEDARDAFMYLCVVEFPPRIGSRSAA